MKMSNEQRRTIYGLSTELGIYEKNNPDDNLHALVFRTVRKSSISDLNFTEANQIISELRSLKNAQYKPQIPVKEVKPNDRPGMISSGQIKMVWRYMYKLEELDKEPSKARLGTRLCGIIEKNLKVSAFEKEPFRFITFEQGKTLIEVVKKMVQNEERKKVRQSKQG